MLMIWLFIDQYILHMTTNCCKEISMQSLGGNLTCVCSSMFKNASTWSSQGNAVLYLLSVACLLMIFPLKRLMFTSILGFILHQIYVGLFTLTKFVPNQKSLSACSTADSSQVWILKVADFCINHISDLIAIIPHEFISSAYQGFLAYRLHIREHGNVSMLRDVHYYCIMSLTSSVVHD